jgi:hypothetical protein
VKRSRLSAEHLLADLVALAQADDLDALIKLLRTAIEVDVRVFANPFVKTWVGRRWRYLFLREAVEDDEALLAASTSRDTRGPRQRIAERFLFEHAAQAWQDEQPRPLLPRSMHATLLFCPGLLNGLLPMREFSDGMPLVEGRHAGLRALRSDSHPARGCDANTADILTAVLMGRGADSRARLIPENKAKPPEGDIVALAYSKGAPDLLTTLVSHPEIAPRFKCIFTLAGAIGGSQVADDVARKYAKLNELTDYRGMAFSIAAKQFAHRMLGSTNAQHRRVDEFDSVAAVRDLTTDVRTAWLAQHAAQLDAMNIPMFTFRGVTSPREIPWSQRRGYGLIAQTEAQNDMQVGATASQLPMPMATELAVFHGHHWDIAYPSFRKRRWLNKTYHPFPKTAALTAMVQLAAELGLIGR